MTARKCSACDVPLRTRSDDPDKFPGSKIHEAKGLCVRCYGREYKQGYSTDIQPTKRIKVDHGTNARGSKKPTDAQLFAERDAFVAARRARGIPPEGLRGGRYLPVDA